MKSVPLTLNVEVPDELDFTDRIAALESRMAALETRASAPAGTSNDAPDPAGVPAIASDETPEESPSGEDEHQPEGEETPSEEPAAPAPPLSPNDKLRSLGNG